jgi:hypothetical protein
VEGEENLSVSDTIPKAMGLTLRTLGTAGAVFFLGLIALTYSTPQWVEDFGAQFIEARVQEKVVAAIDDLNPPEGGALASYASQLYRVNEQEMIRLKRQLKALAQEKMALALAEVRSPECECRLKIIPILELGTAARVGEMLSQNQRLVSFIQGNYMKVATELKRDLRVFTATTASVFLLLLLISLLKPRAIRHLFVPALLLTFATLFSAYSYVFEQNWLLTIIYSDYLGFAYAGYLGVAFAFLCDIVFNRGAVTTTIVNGIGSVLGGVVSLVPC